jgi:hypothetical protein
MVFLYMLLAVLAFCTLCNKLSFWVQIWVQISRFLNVWIDLVIPNMENTSTSTPNDLPLWLTEPQTPKPQADGVVMVRYPRNKNATSAPVKVADSFPPITKYAFRRPTTDFNFTPNPDFNFEITRAPKSVLPVMPDPASKKRKVTCPTHSDWVNGLKFFNRESDNLYTIAGTKHAIKNFTEWWE